MKNENFFFQSTASQTTDNGSMTYFYVDKKSSVSIGNVTSVVDHGGTVENIAASVEGPGTVLNIVSSEQPKLEGKFRSFVYL